MRVLLIILAAAPLAGCMITPGERSRTTHDDAAAELTDGGQSFGDGARLTGPPSNCVRIAELRSSRVRSDRVIDFETSGRRAYRVVLPNRCPGLGFEQRFTYATSLSQLCSADIITVLQGAGSGLMRGASCGLAPFQPIQLPRR